MYGVKYRESISFIGLNCIDIRHNSTTMLRAITLSKTSQMRQVSLILYLILLIVVHVCGLVPISLLFDSKKVLHCQCSFDQCIGTCSRAKPKEVGILVSGNRRISCWNGCCGRNYSINSIRPLHDLLEAARILTTHIKGRVGKRI